MNYQNHYPLDSESEQDGAGYFASATDLLVGFLFIFIILIGVSRVGLEVTEQNWLEQISEISQQKEQLSQQTEQLIQQKEQLLKQTEQLARRVAALSDTSETRSHILQLIATEMKQQMDTDPDLPGITVDLNPELGIIRFGDEQLSSGLFPTRDHILTGAAEKLVALLGATLEQILPCFADYDSHYQLSAIDRQTLASCDLIRTKADGERLYGRLAAVLIEGHTDIDKMQGYIRIDHVGNSHSTNFALSTRRARSAYNVMMGLQQNEDLDDYQANQPPLSESLLFNLTAPIHTDSSGSSVLPKRLIAVSGYGQFSPVVHCLNQQEACKKQNRRIELRFVMAAPEPEL